MGNGRRCIFKALLPFSLFPFPLFSLCPGCSVYVLGLFFIRHILCIFIYDLSYIVTANTTGSSVFSLTSTNYTCVWDLEDSDHMACHYTIF
ncbi:uncharacterized protein BO88DRAFT_274301 [Aspergillus vadensis CBS 113365]|uniref:Uncharacterized protein n=1 Tax=Aspergillus vadensis (strain CBS 113365 / IMI 142717 / IBT 24658) TaxID=1448311 RepID=A0A319BDK6_ASPVC|nr:hypothetical protein BO88DRAFT_274301 [Aspergillus vadensis CBS 113365]PYH70064.1 hypothetical protein BO88DRAFT_274301 [Aspergillus vadensis CBS 113365]